MLHTHLSFASVPLQYEKIVPVLQATLPSTDATKMLEKFPTPRHEGLDFLWEVPGGGGGGMTARIEPHILVMADGD